jgi:hypothetical protein
MNRTYQTMFDMEAGVMTESPCKTCDDRSNLPGCITKCKIIDALQRRTVALVSCSGDPEAGGYRIVVPRGRAS